MLTNLIRKALGNIRSRESFRGFARLWKRGPARPGLQDHARPAGEDRKRRNHEARRRQASIAPNYSGPPLVYKCVEKPNPDSFIGSLWRVECPPTSEQSNLSEADTGNGRSMLSVN
jgi:hypothetical protein